MADKTFAQQIFEAAKVAASSEAGAMELTDVNREQVLKVVETITKAMDELPTGTNLHAVVFGITFVRNALLTAMLHNQRLLQETAGSA